MLVVLPWSNRRTHANPDPWICRTIEPPIRYWRLTANIAAHGGDGQLHRRIDFSSPLKFAAIVGSLLSLMTLSGAMNGRSSPTAWPAGSASRITATVDLFICTYNEEREILERNHYRAMAIDYPNKRFGFSMTAADSAAEPVGGSRLQLSGPARQFHAKAGNINNALAHVAGLDTPPDFISILDC
jgi:cellulose synthase (UDP-forming)